MKIATPDREAPVMPEGMQATWEEWQSDEGVTFAVCLNVYAMNSAGRRGFVRTIVCASDEECEDEMYDWLAGIECQECFC